MRGEEALLRVRSGVFLKNPASLKMQFREKSCFNVPFHGGAVHLRFRFPQLDQWGVLAGVSCQSYNIGGVMDYRVVTFLT